MTFVNYTPFPTVPRILGSRHYIFVFYPWNLDNRCYPKWTEAGNFPQTITGSRPTSRKQHSRSVQQVKRLFLFPRISEIRIKPAAKTPPLPAKPFRIASWNVRTLYEAAQYFYISTTIQANFYLTDTLSKLAYHHRSGAIRAEGANYATSLRRRRPKQQRCISVRRRRELCAPTATKAHRV